MKRLTLAGLVLVAIFAAWAPLRPLARAQGKPNLSEVLTTPNGRMSVRYPAGWAGLDDVVPGTLILGPSEAVIDQAIAEEVPLEGVDLVMLIISPPSTIPFFEDISAAETAREAAEVVMAISEGDTIFDAIEEIEIGGHPAAYVPARTPLNLGFLAVIGFDDGYVVVTAVGSVAGYADQKPLALAILDTLTYAIPEGIASFTTEAGDLTLEYPAAWLTAEIVPGAVIVADGLVDLRELSEIEAGDAVIVYVILDRALIDLDILEEVGDLADIAETFFAAEVETDYTERIDRDRPAAHDRVYIDYVGENSAGYVLVREYEGGLVVIWVFAGQEILDDYAPEIDAIIDSIQYPSGDE
jgi:hypothetical protein